MKFNSRLSCLQIVIIAVVFGIVARTVGSKFSEASWEVKVCDLVDGLETMRAHLDLYRAHHNGSLPPKDSFATFEAAITTRSGEYAPYVKKIPTNPFNKLNTVRFDGEPAGLDKAGWRLDTKTGLFRADNDAGYAAL